MLEDLATGRGGGQNQEKLVQITSDRIKFLPNCTLKVTTQELGNGTYCFTTTPSTKEPCQVTYQGNTFQVFLGFKATRDELLTYDKGIDPATGQGTWGALMGAYCFHKRENLA